MTTSARRPSARVVLGPMAVLGGLLMILASFLTWISAPTGTGGRATISGWGAISGDSQISGTNLNDVLAMGGTGSYRPALVGLIFGVVAAITGVCVAAVQGSSRPHRVTAAVLVLCGLVGTGWGVVRIVAPGDAGVFDPGEQSSGAGPWLLAAGGLIAVLVAAAIFAGALDHAEPMRSRGIQPG